MDFHFVFVADVVLDQKIGRILSSVTLVFFLNDVFFLPNFA